MADILYVCDRTKCPECHDECEHTTDISHAVNFWHSTYGDKECYIEINKEFYGLCKTCWKFDICKRQLLVDENDYCSRWQGENLDEKV